MLASPQKSPENRLAGFFYIVGGTHMREPAPLPFCAYVLLSLKDGNFYVGYSTELTRRLDEHFQGRNTSTAPRRPFVLVHCEYYLARSDAERRETYLKTAKGRRVLRLMLNDSLAEVRQLASAP
jgi:putative endonuclease